MSKNVLVTGATGSIGQHLVPFLLERGDTVHVIARMPNKVQSFEWGDKVKIHTIDFADRDSVVELYREVQPGEIYHFAASVMQWGNTDSLELLTKVNILGTVTLMESLSEIPNAHFVYPGTFAELGGKQDPIREDHEPNPQEFYSISKLVGTLEAKQLAKNKGYNIVVGRIFSAYGPGMPKERLVGQLITKAIANESITLVDKDITRDLIYVTDIVRCFIELAGRAEELKGEVFNVGTGEKTTLLKAWTMVKELTDSNSEVVWKPERRTTYDSLPWCADMTKTFKILSWRPEISLEEGIQKTYDSFREIS